MYNRHNVCHQVVLEDAKTGDKPSVKPQKTPTLSAEDIEKKLQVETTQGILSTKDIYMQEVENRRRSMEAQTLEKLAEKERRAEEVRAKKAAGPPPAPAEEAE